MGLLLKADQIKLSNEQRCDACPLKETWPNLHTPKMLPNGPEEAKIYIVGEAPGATEDAEGIPFMGLSGKVLRDALSQVGITDFRINNTVRCRPPGNATPTWHSTEACRRFLEEDIAKIKPKVVIAVGSIPLKWFAPQGSVILWSGKPFPKKLNGDSFWVIPILHPAFVLRNRQKSVYQEFLRSLRMAKTVFDTYPDASVAVKTIADLGEARYVMTLQELRIHQPAWMNQAEITVDLETTGLDPISGQILTVSLTNDCGNTIAFPITHPESPDKFHTEKLIILEAILSSAHHLVAQNATFEIRWLVQHLPNHDAYKWRWDDTMVMSYILDCHPAGHGQGLHSLDTMALLVLGIENFKDASDVDVTNLKNEPLFKVLKYNGLDSIATSLIARKLRKRLTEANLMHGYRMHRNRLTSLSMLMLEGLPFDKATADLLLLEQKNHESEVEHNISQYDVVTQYQSFEKLPFNPMSASQVKKLMVGSGMIGPDDSTDEERISTVDHPIAKSILDLRSTHKLVKFYEDFVMKQHPIDGKIHANFNHSFTVTGRLSSSYPNLQNLKKGKPRSIIAAPEGKVLIGADYGQLEACVIAALSEDVYFINAIINGLDVHADCARDLAKLDKRCAKLAEKDFKKFRSAVKNMWVFPAFYMAAVPSLAGYMGISLPKAQKYYDQFWVRFKGVRAWQQRLMQDYDRTGYVYGPTGRRYSGIIGPNDIVNYPVQGSASDLVVEAGNRAVEAGLIPCVNVHDELMWCVWEEEAQMTLETVKNILLDMPNPTYFSWLTVPLSITLKMGKSWDTLEEIGKFNSSWTSVKNGIKS